MELRFCNEHGIPHSIFLGRVWPNPDDPYEPYWIEEDWKKAIAYQVHTSEVCEQCGTTNDMWLDEDNFPLDPPLYEVESFRCHGCYQMGLMRKTIPSEEEGVRPVIKRFHVPEDRV